MYQITVYYSGDTFARSTHTARSGAGVFDLILRLRDEHPGCERIEVRMRSEAVRRGLRWQSTVLRPRCG